MPSSADTSRRHFLASAAATALGFAALQRHASAASLASVLSDDAGYGPLVADPRGILDLPQGFSYSVLSRAGDEMEDGLLVPGKPDGMAAFPAPNDATGRFCVIVRNHELDPNSHAESGFGADNSRFNRLSPEMRRRLYDGGYGYTPNLGGTTTLLVDLKEPARPRIARQFLSLGGTVRNCAGGPTPWGSWITCEETVIGVGPQTERSHGFNFEVPADPAGGLVEPRPLEAMGRFVHEAIAVDPRSGAVYQTEDVHDGQIYRFLPNVPGELHRGGRLQALAIRDMHGIDLRNWETQTVEIGQKLPVEWIDMEDVLNPNNDLRYRGFEKGTACFARGEGMWFGNDRVYFACTNGGRLKKGQIWQYVPSRVEGQSSESDEPGHLTLICEPNDGEIVDNADNLTVSPWGDLIVCEDGAGEQYLRGLTRDGKLYTLAKNAGDSSEFAGVCFDPGGRVLFVNIQHAGLTLAITGPWQGRDA